MEEPVPFPLSWRNKKLLEAQQKLEKLVKKRDRLNVRINFLDKCIIEFWANARHQDQFWEDLRKEMEGKANE
jgi:hypothetical protein